MRRLFIVIISFFFLGLGQQAQAQYYDHAIGLRAGTSFELSYKRFILVQPRYPIQLAVEGLAGFQLDEDGIRGWPRKGNFNGFVLEALAAIHIDLGFNTGFSGYAGLGPFGGIYVEPGQKPIGGGGGTAVIGVSYTFTHILLNIAIDWKPMLGFPRSSITRGALTLRYVFAPAWQ